MKKTLKFILVAALVASALAIAAFAAVDVNYYLDTIDADKGQYDLYININSDLPIGTFATNFTFNNELLMPTDDTYAPIDISAASTKDDTSIYPAEVKVGKKTYSYALADNTWKTTGNKTQFWLAAYSTDADKFTSTDLDIVSITFKLADGKTLADITESDFVIDMIYAVDSEGTRYGYNESNAKVDVAFTNNVPTKTPTPSKLTVPVTAGDIIYLQDDTTVKAETTGDFELPKTDDGYVVVNTGFTAQKLYKVESGKITEVTSNENGVLATDSASLRKDSVATGLRFKTSFLTSLKDSVKEYGVLVTVESKNNDLPKNYVLNMALVNAGKAKKGVAFNKANGTDIYYDVDGARTIVTAVATGIPLTKDAVTTNIAARPYYELEDGTIIYGETVKRQAAEVAQKIKNEDAETYAKYKDYIDQIIALVAEDPTYATIDLGPLFS